MKTADFIKEHPVCCFCGGSVASATIDHQPAKIIFPDKWRPKGLEFPACLRCNQQTSVDECLLAFVARMGGSLRGTAEIDEGFKRALETLKVAKPDLLLRMRAMTADGRGGLNVDQPELDERFCRIAAKLAMGLYYEERRKIVSTCSLVNAFWTHNQREGGKELVPKVLSMFPSSRHLKQGKKDTEDTFYIRYVVDGPTVQVGAVFYESVALMAHFDDTCEYSEGHDWQYAFTPHPGVGIKTVSVDGDGGKAWHEAMMR
jgi:hypothetical protein